MRSQPSGEESEQSAFGLLCNFTGNDSSSSVQRIFHIGRQDCDVDRWSDDFNRGPTYP